MAHVYERRKDPDGFLYITYTDETTLGEMVEFDETILEESEETALVEMTLWSIILTLYISIYLELNKYLSQLILLIQIIIYSSIWSILFEFLEDQLAEDFFCLLKVALASLEDCGTSVKASIAIISQLWCHLIDIVIYILGGHFQLFWIY